MVKRAAISELEHAPADAGHFRHRAGRRGHRLGGATQPPVIRSHSVLPNLGNPTPLHLKYAEQLRDALPDNVTAAARDPLDAVGADLRDAVQSG